MANITPQFIIEGLTRRGYPEHVAQGFVMNMMDESGLNPGINEVAPIVPGSRGGFGLYQLTGPRRTAYERFAAQRGVNPADPEAQLDFLDYELKGPESRAAKSILSTQNPQQAAIAIARDFLRPASEHLDRRVAKYGGADIAADTMAALGKGGGQMMAQPNVNPQQMAQGVAPAQAAQGGKQGILGGLLGNPDTMAALAMAFNSMRLNPDPNLSAVLSGQMKERRGQRKSEAQANRTLEYLRKLGTPQAAQALAYAEGTGDIAGALKMAMAQGGDERTALIKNYEYARSTGYDGSFQDFLKSGGAGGSVVNVGDQQYQIAGDQVIVPDPNSPAGVRFVPIPGGKTAAAAEAEQRRKGVVEQQSATKESVIARDVDRLIDMIDRGGIFNLPEAGVIGEALSSDILGPLRNQEAVTFKNMLAGIQSNVAFDRLQQMREASKTGGALGAVSERELDLLISALGAIQQSTDPEILKENLKFIRDTMSKIEADPVASQAYYGGGQGGVAPSSGGFGVTGVLD